MYRHTPLASGFRAYSAGGGRAMIDTIDDSKQMQEPTDTQGMRGEQFSSMEAPQNYGFTSVVADADKGPNGMIKDCAEGFINFMGGNRSFPVMGLMDDRRHRLLNLAKDAAKGATAMFGLKEWGQQFLNTADGMFMTGNTKKKMRFQLVNNKNDQQQQPSQQQQANGAGGGSSGSASQTQQQEKGQKTLHKEDSSQYFDMTTGSLHHANGSSHHEVKGDRTVGYYSDNEKSYRADKGHTHIKNSGAHVWVDGACKKSMPFVISPDPCT